jgi:multiple sugar transport system ATP-binding protein
VLFRSLNRKPANLSGGQRQRVAVGRAMVRNPKIFLFDEPLSNLDAKLRGTMRKELKLLHSQLQTTMLYVTHDQIEALTLADRIVIMKDGYIQQIGTPTEVYTNPVNLFVAKFIGLPAMNIFNSHFNGQEINVNNSRYPLTNPEVLKMLKSYANQELAVGVRPEHLILEKTNTGKGAIPAVVENVELLGSETLIHIMLDNQKVLAKSHVRDDIKIGDQVFLKLDEQHIYFFDLATEGRIYAT